MDKFPGKMRIALKMIFNSWVFLVQLLVFKIWSILMYVTPCSYAKDLRNFCDPDSYDNQSSIRKHAESRSAAPVGGVGGVGQAHYQFFQTKWINVFRQQISKVVISTWKMQNVLNEWNINCAFFSFWDMVVFVLEIGQIFWWILSEKSTITWKNINRKIDFPLISAQCASFL